MQEQKAMGPGGKCCKNCNAYLPVTQVDCEELLAIDVGKCCAHPKLINKNNWQWCREWQQSAKI